MIEGKAQALTVINYLDDSEATVKLFRNSSSLSEKMLCLDPPNKANYVITMTMNATNGFLPPAKRGFGFSRIISHRQY
jgi:transcriptional regulator CtsR